MTGIARLVAILIAIAQVSLAAGAQPAPAPQTRDASAFPLDETNIDALQEAFADRRVSCRQVVAHYLARIDAYDQRGPRLNAVVVVHPGIRDEADRLDTALRASGPTGPLHCVPMLVKDAFETAEMPTSFGSAAFKGLSVGLRRDRDRAVAACRGPRHREIHAR